MRDFMLNREKCRLNMDNMNWKTRLRQLGVAGFLFFLGKGLVWLAVFFGLFKMC